MKITDSAAKAILNVMNKKGLNAKDTFFEISIFDGNLGIGFTKYRHGKTIKFGELSIVISEKVDTEGVIIDFGEIEGRNGLLIKGENDGSNNVN